MPYGSKTYRSYKPVVTRSKNGGAAPIVWTGQEQSESMSRSGSDVNSVNRGSAGRPLVGRFESVVLPVLDKKTGKPVVVPVEHTRLDGSTYIVREPLLRYSYRNMLTKSKAKTGDNLLPNTLSYREVRVKSALSKETLTGSHPSGAWQTYTGDLWGTFQLYATGSYASAGLEEYINANPSSAATSLATTLSNEALKQLYSTVKNQKVNLAVMLAESKKTAQMVVELALRLGGAAVKLRKGDAKGAWKLFSPQSIKGVANDYLVYTYGLEPLMKDIDGMVSHIAKPSEQVTFDCKAVRSRKVVTEVAHPVRAFVPPIETKVVIESEVTVIYKVQLAVNTQVGRQFNRLGFTNPLVVGWELIPFSFVYDWFHPIGNWLEGLDAFANLRQVYVTKTVFIKETVKWERTLGGNTSDGWSWNKVPIVAEVVRTYCERTKPTTVFPLPFPSFKNPFSARHALNALALMIQSFKKGK